MDTPQPTSSDQFPVAPQVVSPQPKPKSNIILWILLIILLFGSGWGLYLTAREQGWLPSSVAPTPTPVAIVEPTPTPDPTANWETYRFDGGSFRYPSNWEESPIQTRGSGFTQEIQDESEFYQLTFSTQGNYSQITGKPFSTIDEYVGMSSRAKTVDGQEARQYLPRAGSENINESSFFSKDQKIIYTLSLQIGMGTISDPRVTEASTEESLIIYNQILSTFKFTSPTLSPAP